MSLGDFESILRVLKQFRRGHFSFIDEDGDRFVVVRKEEFDRTREQAAEQQLSLPPMPERPVESSASADDVLERINREIASYQLQQEESSLPLDEPEASEIHQEQEIDDLALGRQMPTSFSEAARRVRFEPLKGDLPPELQE